MSSGYSLPALPYAFDALEPHIDEATMKVHHGGHHQAYTDKLNGGIEALKASQPDLAALPVEKLVQNLDKVTDVKLRGLLRNNGGGYINHLHFWKWMAPPASAGAGAAGEASSAAAAAIKENFGSIEAFKEQFSNAAATVFGSGWAWLVFNSATGKLEVAATPNQDNPNFDPSKKPILGLDVWEHAYYLKYQNKRAAYIAAWWNVVNWTYVDELLAAAKTETTA